jgi:hypothetical protein
MTASCGRCSATDGAFVALIYAQLLCLHHDDVGFRQIDSKVDIGTDLSQEYAMALGMVEKQGKGQ